MEFDKERSGTGTMEWAEVTENITIGCPNDCRYCYAAHNANRFGYQDRANWREERFNKRSSMKSYPAKDGVIMFPSSHDITPFNVVEYIRVAKLMLEKGNKLLIVSKPRLEIIKKVCAALEKYKDKILFRFTIGTMVAENSLSWEPGAPLPEERVDALRHCFENGFNTSVSIEPMLGGSGSASAVVVATQEIVTDTIWIGKMNKVRLRVDMSNKQVAKAVEYIEKVQSDEKIIKLYNEYKGHPLIRWKDSIKAVIEKQNS